MKRKIKLDKKTHLVEHEYAGCISLQYEYSDPILYERFSRKLKYLNDVHIRYMYIITLYYKVYLDFLKKKHSIKIISYLEETKFL